MDRQNLNYEELYDRLLERGMVLHRNNKKRIRIGFIILAVFTVAMIFIRWLTDSDRVVFMVIWVIGMFVISIYLVSIEYIDSSVQKTLEEVTEREVGFGDLLPDSEEVSGMLHERLTERFDGIQVHHLDHRRQADTDAASVDTKDAPADKNDAADSYAAESEDEE